MRARGGDGRRNRESSETTSNGGFRFDVSHGGWLLPTGAHRRDELGGGGGAKNGGDGGELQAGEVAENDNVYAEYRVYVAVIFFVLVHFIFCFVFF